MRKIHFFTLWALMLSSRAIAASGIDAACGGSSAPLSGIDEPLPPQNPGSSPLHFPACGTNTSCDHAMAQIYNDYVSERDGIAKSTQEICEGAKAEQEKCDGQANSHACLAQIQKNVGGQFSSLKDRLAEKAKKLRANSVIAFNEAKKNEAALNQPARDKLKSTVQEAEKGKLDNERLNQVNKCKTAHASALPLCQMLMVGRESLYYANKFSKVSDDMRAHAASFHAAAQKSENSAQELGNGGGDGNKDGGMLGGMNLDSLMKMATLGMTGAGMYCGMTGKCTPQQAAGAGDATTGPTGGATSPTPKSSNLSAGNTSSGGTESAPGTNTDTKTSDSGGGFAAIGSGISDPAYSQFSGDTQPSRGPAANGLTGGVVGGDSGSGAGGGDSASPNANGKPAEVPIPALENTLNFPAGGGMGGGAGTFSLDANNASSPADAALKDILNGDLPPGGDPLAGLEGELGADSASQDGVGAADSENLFRRVNAFYIKCQKTGCVAHGVGDTI